ncbi:MAG: PAS domain-containing sensor histidine kinase [Rubrivivax sp.]|nr:PAS domain-containing sensor histidine kinase [Rubrivivax sp.]
MATRSLREKLAAIVKPSDIVPGFEAFDQLATMVAVVRPDGRCVLANSALENVIGMSRRALQRGNAFEWLADPTPLAEHARRVAANLVATSRFDALLRRVAPQAQGELPVHVILSQIDLGAPGGARGDAVLLEMIEIEQQTRQEREERVQELVTAHKELVRNLAHEIRNPLGGIRGAAQLLELEIGSRELKEYTRVIVHEADRLQALVDRLLAPHRRAPVVGDVNIHEVCERVRALVLAEFPRGLTVRRDYDTSIPEFRGDREQLIQAVLNIVHNAAQALGSRIAAGDARIELRTRVARQVTIGRQRFRLALELHIQDNGPGVPEAIRDRIFQPLVSGRDEGHGLGLTLAQTFVQQHQGIIECESAPGRTVFKLVIPLP